MPVVITGDMTAEEIDQAIINDLNALVASSGAETIQVEHRSIVRLLELLGDKGKPKEIKSEAKPQGRAAPVVADDDDDDDDDKPATRGRTRR
jgi:hypothetical protein